MAARQGLLGCQTGSSEAGGRTPEVGTTGVGVVGDPGSFEAISAFTAEMSFDFLEDEDGPVESDAAAAGDGDTGGGFLDLSDLASEEEGAAASEDGEGGAAS